MKNLLLVICAMLSVAIFTQCNTDTRTAGKPAKDTATLTEDQIEAREDSIALAKAYEAQGKITMSIPALAETQVVDAKATDDAADDPAIWVHPTDASQSLVYGSNKKGGLGVYNLEGKEIKFYPLGKINNVDIVSDVKLGGKTVQLLGCSNRTHNSMDIFVINPKNGELTNVAKDTLFVGKNIDDAYGFCFATDKKTKKHYAIVNGKNGVMNQFEIQDQKGKVALELKREIKFDSQTEGMAADTEYGNLYVGEENVGVWKLSIDPTSKEKTFITTSSTKENANIRKDVEGITLYKQGKEGFLIVSSQGNFSYAMFERTGDNKYIGSFKVSDANAVDGVEETDGLDVVNANLGDKYPAGILVFQDGFNHEGKGLQPQNFKYASIADVLKQLKK